MTESEKLRFEIEELQAINQKLETENKRLNIKIKSIEDSYNENLIKRIDYENYLVEQIDDSKNIIKTLLEFLPTWATACKEEAEKFLRK